MTDQHLSGIERRRHQRIRLSREIRGIRLDPDCDEVVDSLEAFDVSRSGLGAVTDRSYYPGQRVMLCMPRTEQAGERSIYATIVRCRPRNDQYMIGMEFDGASQSNVCSLADAFVAA